jgi:phosphatidylinositol 4-phosphatase
VSAANRSLLSENYARNLQLEKAFRILWADHGDALSWQYAGTGALKSGFTRTGKRSLMGLLDDGWKSAVRYYLNNYEDGHKQDAIDLITGSYLPLEVCVGSRC